MQKPLGLVCRNGWERPGDPCFRSHRVLEAGLYERFWSELREALNAAYNADGKDRAQEFSTGNKGSIGSWTYVNNVC